MCFHCGLLFFVSVFLKAARESKSVSLQTWTPKSQHPSTTVKFLVQKSFHDTVCIFFLCTPTKPAILPHYTGTLIPPPDPSEWRINDCHSSHRSFHFLPIGQKRDRGHIRHADEKCLETQKAFPLEQKDCLHQCDVVSIRIHYLQ